MRLHVWGTIRYAELHRFVPAVGRFCDFRRQKGRAVPRVFVTLASGMNTVLMVFDYPNAADWEKKEAAVGADIEYARVASEMPYVEGSIESELFQPVEDLMAHVRTMTAKGGA
jgi:hypothetical protein